MADDEDLRIGEVGKSGANVYGNLILEDYNPKLRGWQAIDTYDEMRRNDAKVRAILRIVKAPLLSGQWYVDPHGDDPRAQEAADFLWWALNGMSRSITQTLYEILSFLDFGYYPFEVVWERGEWRGRSVLKWQKWAPRHPRTIAEWKFDAHGGVQGLVQSVDSGEVPIPIEKLLLFVFDEEANNPEGMSILRSAYKHWYYKENFYKIDGIQKERHGIGIPHVQYPEGATPNDKTKAEEMAKNLRTNEKAYVVTPPGLEVGFLQLSGEPVDVIASAEHHDLMLSSSVLAQFLNLGSSNTGSRAISESQQDMFSRATWYIADLVRNVINKWAFEPLLRRNGFRDLERPPELRVRNIGEEAQWRSFAVALRNLVEPGVVTPDDDLEDFVRRVVGLPQALTRRSVEDRIGKDEQSPNGDGPRPSGQRPASRTGRPRE